MIASIVFVNHLHIGNRDTRIADRTELWIDHVALITKTKQIMLIPKKAFQLCTQTDCICIDNVYKYLYISIYILLILSIVNVESSTIWGEDCVSSARNYECYELRPIMNMDATHNASLCVSCLDPDRACAYRTVHQLRHVSTPSAQAHFNIRRT